jgi:hypothetical protein
MQVTDPAARGSRFTAEIKFFVEARVGAQIREWARSRLEPDPYGAGPLGDEYSVSSVYFDTDARDVFHRRASYGRSKYRIRRYQESQTVFLERKLRNGTRLSKRRTVIDLGTLPLLSIPGALNGDGTAWFRRRVALRRLEPVCQVTYTRTARVGTMTDGSVRLTLDGDLRAIVNGSCAFQMDPGTAVLDESMILELKYQGRIPAIFRQLMDEFRIAPRRSSKYRLAARALGLVKTAPGETPQMLDA